MRLFKLVLAVFLFPFLLFSAGPIYSEDMAPIELPKPHMDGGRPLMQVLGERASSREFSTNKLSMQMLSDLFWAAFGINRPESGKRTAPSAMNSQEIDLYAAMEEGLFIYDAIGHRLNPVFKKDIRQHTGKQPFVKDAPLNIVYVADLSRVTRIPEEKRGFYSAANTGFIAQNVYLFCTSEGLATVVRGWIDIPALERAMNLKPTQKVILSQTVGYPK